MARTQDEIIAGVHLSSRYAALFVGGFLGLVTCGWFLSWASDRQEVSLVYGFMWIAGWALLVQGVTAAWMASENVAAHLMVYAERTAAKEAARVEQAAASRRERDARIATRVERIRNSKAQSDLSDEVEK